MTPQRLQQLIDRFPSRRIAVVGDFFLDKYLEVDPALAETSLETGKRANQVVAVRCSPGAAGTVVNNLASLKAGVRRDLPAAAGSGCRELRSPESPRFRGSEWNRIRSLKRCCFPLARQTDSQAAGTLHAVGATGDDGEAYELRHGLQQRGCSTDRLFKFDSLLTPTYLKPRDFSRPGLSGEHQRYDTKNRTATPADVGERVVAALDAILPELDAVIIADQVPEADCGIITAAVRDALSRRACRYRRLIFWADSRSHIREFRHVIIKPNQFEAVGHSDPLSGDQISLPELRAAVSRLREEIAAPVCVTRGEHGLLVSDPELTVIPAVRLDGPIDPTGAGDSVTAGAVLVLASGGTLPEAALVGGLVASITVGQLGTTGTATPSELLERLELWRQQNHKVRQRTFES